MVAAGAQIDREIHVQRAPRAEKDRRPFRPQARPVGGDQHICPHRLAVLCAELAQARGADLLTRLDQQLEIEAEFATRLQRGCERGEVDRVLSLVIGRSAAVQTIALAGQRPWIESCAPVRFLSADYVAVTVGKHRDARRIFGPFGEQERPSARRRVLKHPAAKPQTLEARLHFRDEITPQVQHPLRILALARNRDAARQISEEFSLVEIALGALDGFFPAHAGMVRLLALPGERRVASSRNASGSSTQPANNTSGP